MRNLVGVFLILVLPLFGFAQDSFGLKSLKGVTKVKVDFSFKATPELAPLYNRFPKYTYRKIAKDSLKEAGIAYETDGDSALPELVIDFFLIDNTFGELADNEQTGPALAYFFQVYLIKEVAANSVHTDRIITYEGTRITGMVSKARAGKTIDTFRYLMGLFIQDWKKAQQEP